MAKNKGGRPTLFKEEYTELVYKLCLLGATDKQMADILGIAESTFHKWKLDYPQFMESITRGKVIADAEVAASLRERAMGYSHPDVHVSSYEGSVTLTPITKHYPPDTNAAAIWLYNRQPDKWKRSPSPDDNDDDVLPVQININVVDASKSGES